MLIDNIAPAGMKASYFSAQSLGWLGAAVNPLVSGVILTTLPPWSLFVALMVAIVWLGVNDKRHARQTLEPAGSLLKITATVPKRHCRLIQMATNPRTPSAAIFSPDPR